MNGILVARQTVGLLLLCAPAGAETSLVNFTTFDAYSIPSTGNGNLIVVASSSAWLTTPTINSVSHNAGNAYVQAGSARAVDGTKEMVDIWCAKNSKSGATMVAVTPNPSGNNGAAVVWEFSGVDILSPLDRRAVLNSQPATNSPVDAFVTLPGNAVTDNVPFFGKGRALLVTPSTYARSAVSSKAAISGGGGYSPCDLTQDGTVDQADVQLAIDMSLGTAPCTTGIGGGVCNVVVVQRVINAALGGTCVDGGGVIPHAASLSWSPSTSPNVVGYNAYRGTTSGGPYAKLNSSPISGTTYMDDAVQAGQTFYYVATAIDSNNAESAYSNEASAAVRSP